MPARRPHMTLRVGDIDVIIAYEQRGNKWSLYTIKAGGAPGATDQHFYTTVLECHEAWMRLCVAAINGSDEMFAPAADAGTREHIAVILKDI